MSNLIFLSLLSCLLTLLLIWGFIHLPRERWQMLAVVPLKKNDEGQWLGLNLTYYGFFIATAQLFAVTLLLILLGAARISLPGTLVATVALLAFCIPASRIIAILVEKKRHTFTVGGASFVGILLAPWIVLLVDNVINFSFFPCHLPMLPVLGAMAIAYTLGEGLGRLGCISFGCCYGKRLRDCSPVVGRIFSRWPLVFNGSTKKAVYEGSLAGEPLVPIQAITSIVCCLTAILASHFYLLGQYAVAFLLGIGVNQLWRILSETLRADFRGFRRISAYQKMGGLAVLYAFCVVHVSRTPHLADPVIGQGFSLLWQPALIIGLQLLWLVFFLFFGRSTVTTAKLSFGLVREHL